MNETPSGFESSLVGLKQSDWLVSIQRLMEDLGDYSELDPDHFMTFVKQGTTLLVTFETIQGILSLTDTAHPLGFELAESEGWSHLCLISDGDTWFRSRELFAMFDELTDNGFFDDFEHVVFYGAGPCGYAAAAYSVSAPGATVVAIQPQATLDPDVAGWDNRFIDVRRLPFRNRYGFAPDMVDAAKSVFVAYDPNESLDAMHAVLFQSPHVERLKMPNMGDTLQTSLLEMNILFDVLRLAGQGDLTRGEFFKLYRARRNYGSYLKSLLARLDHDDRSFLNVLLCRSVSERMVAPKFQRRLQILEREAEEGKFRAPVARIG